MLYTMLYDIENVVANKGHCSFTLKGEEQRGEKSKYRVVPLGGIGHGHAMCCTLHCQLLSEFFKMTDINDKHFIC